VFRILRKEIICQAFGGHLEKNISRGPTMLPFSSSPSSSCFSSSITVPATVSGGLLEWQILTHKLEHRDVLAVVTLRAMKRKIRER
jgi:hypothetical protein